MDMEPAAGTIAIGLGHECRQQPVLGGNPAHQPLPLDGFVGRLEGIGAMAQHDLELTRRVFGDQSFRRQPHDFRGTIKVVDEGGEFLQLGHAVDIDPIKPPAGCRRLRRLNLAVQPARRIDDIEFQLSCDHRPKPIAHQPLHHPGQHMAWVGDKGRAVEIVEAEQHLAGRPRHPGCELQRTGDGPGDLVLIALVPDQPGFLHVLACDIEAHDGTGEGAAFLIHLGKISGAQKFAPRDSRGIGDEGLGCL